MPKKVTENKKNVGQMTNIYTWNVRLALVFGLQGVFVLLLSATKLFPIGISYMTRDPIASELAGHPVMAIATKHLFDINLASVAAGIFFVAAAAHVAAATVCRISYETGLKKGINCLRWAEYAVGTGLLSIAIALLAGVRDLIILSLLFVLALGMVLVRLAIDISRSHNKDNSNYLLSGISIVGGAVIPVIILVYFWVTGVYGSDGLPVFVYVLVGSTLALAGGFATNLYLQNRRIGKWADYFYGERVFMLLSLVAKTVLVWQIFAGALRA